MIDILDEIIKTINLSKKLKSSYDFSYISQKYKIKDILNGILYVLETGIPWNKFKDNIKSGSLYYHFVKLTKHDIFKKTYYRILNNYLSVNMDTLECQLTDKTSEKTIILFTRLWFSHLFENPEGV